MFVIHNNNKNYFSNIKNKSTNYDGALVPFTLLAQTACYR